jgi:ferritin-like metal-binding protein YciE
MTEITEQLTKYLTDAHSIEEQALAQMRTAPEIAGDPELAAAYREHLKETEGHERLVRELLEARDAKPSRTKDTVMALGGKGFLLFAKLQPDTPGKLAAFARAFEHLEIGGYEQLRRVAEKAGDDETAQVVERILAQEREAADRIAGAFDEAVTASLDAQGVVQ